MTSKGKNQKPVIDKEEKSDNWCFVCKDGGDLRICDYKNCRKPYHPSCVDKDDSFLESDDHWTCSWHTCFVCHKRSSHLHCYTCTNAVCRHCLPAADLHRVKGQYGFCNSCLKLALLIEDKKDYDSDGEKVDFEDRGTMEFLFKEYYVIIKKEEGLNPCDIRALRDSVKTAIIYSSEENYDEENDQISDYDGEHAKKCRRARIKKRSRRKVFGVQTPIKSNKNDFVGWGSRSLIDFLSSIGKSTDKKLSERDVTSIVIEYVKENKLMDPEKTKMIICDAQLQSLFRKRKIHKNKVSELLEEHFAENCVESEEEDEGGYDSGGDDTGYPRVCKRQRKLDMEKKPSEKELTDDVLLGCFASIIEENIKLIYLKRTLVLEMLKHPESFEEKVVGCFVRVMSDPLGSRSRNSFQLMQVRGVGRVSTDQNNTEAILLFSAMPKEISTNLLSDDDFSKEECEDLTRKVNSGQVERPTVEDLQQKANIVHVDITKHRIKKEIALLKNRIEQANEKGWRNICFELRDMKKRLEMSLDESKLLENIPKVIPDLNEESEKKTQHCSEPPQPTTELKNEKPGGQELGMCSQETLHERTTRNSHKASSTVVDLVSDDENSSEGKAADATRQDPKNSSEGKAADAARQDPKNSNEGKAADAARQDPKNSNAGKAADATRQDPKNSNEGIAADATHDDLKNSNEGKAADATHEDLKNSNEGKAADATRQDLKYSIEGKSADATRQDLKNSNESKAADATHEDLKNSNEGKAADATHEDLKNSNEGKSADATRQDLKNSNEGKAADATHQDLKNSNEGKASDATRQDLKNSIEGKSADATHQDLKNSNEGKADDATHQDLKNSNEGNASDAMWYVRDRYGNLGKFYASVLRVHCDFNDNAHEFKAWKEDDNEENAVLLSEAFKIALPKKKKARLTVPKK